MTNVLVASVFVVHLAVGAAAFEITLTEQRHVGQGREGGARGADLEYLSAFPAEKELLYPPLTFLQPTGWSMEHSVGGVKFTVIEVEPFAG